jgi:ABC-type sugar transport system ATPase subunit
MTTITVEHASKTFLPENGGHPVLAVDNVYLKMSSGDVLAILGPSGCGKSTLLRLIAGIFKPDRGRILYDEVDLNQIPLRERGVGMVFQEGALIPHWEARRSVGFYLNLRHREIEVPEKLRQVSKITGIGLDKLLERRPAQLSGGEKQRVGIARALARDLKVLLFDEPFANLDAKYRAEARVELKRLLNAFPVTAVYVTHDQHEAIALSHRIAVMRSGQIEQVGTYQQLYSSPHNLFVAQFIGTPPINLLEGQVIDGHWKGVNFGGYSVRKDLEDGARMTLGVRPEHIMLAPEGAPCVVDQITPYLAERFQLVSVHANHEYWSLMAPLDQRIRIGETLHCALMSEEILLFDPKTGLRVG